MIIACGTVIAQGSRLTCLLPSSSRISGTIGIRAIRKLTLKPSPTCTVSGDS